MFLFHFSINHFSLCGILHHISFSILSLYLLSSPFYSVNKSYFCVQIFHPIDISSNPEPPWQKDGLVSILISPLTLFRVWNLSVWVMVARELLCVLSVLASLTLKHFTCTDLTWLIQEISVWLVKLQVSMSEFCNICGYYQERCAVRKGICMNNIQKENWEAQKTFFHIRLVFSDSICIETMLICCSTSNANQG